LQAVLYPVKESSMTNKIRAAAFLLLLCLIAIGLNRSFMPAASSSHSVAGPKVAASSHVIVAQAQDCAKCEEKCKTWIDKCKDGGQYACYKAAACLCKCNLDAGGCGSSKKALEECYEENKKHAKQLGPSKDPEK
jgi:hypothetical protein